jgi:hypothetical protein
VIYIITKSTRDTKGVFASAGGGNMEQGFFNFRYGGGSNSGLTHRAYAKGFTREPGVEIVVIRMIFHRKTASRCQ